MKDINESEFSVEELTMIFYYFANDQQLQKINVLTRPHGDTTLLKRNKIKIMGFDIFFQVEKLGNIFGLKATKIQGTVLRKLSETQNKMWKNLNLSENDTLSNSDLIFVVKNLTNLTELNLDKIITVRDSTLEAVGECKKLVTLR
jgi:hypothetical protein